MGADSKCPEAGGKVIFGTFMPNHEDYISIHADCTEVGLEPGTSCYPLDWYSVPKIYEGLRRGEDVRVAPFYEMTPRPSEAEEVPDWLISNAPLYRKPTPSIEVGAHLSMTARSMIDKPPFAKELLEMAAKPLTPLAMAVRGFEPNLASAVEQLGLAISPVSMLIALVVHPEAYSMTGEDHDPVELVDRICHCSVEDLGINFWEHMYMGAGPEKPETIKCFSSSNQLVAALAYMAWEPHGRYFEYGGEARRALYWASVCKRRVKFYETASNAPKKMGAVSTTALAVADTTEHVLHYILANWLNSASDKYVFEPNKFFTDIRWSQLWLESQGARQA